ncbi:metallophosphoesterase [Aquisalimonas lutea]|uniref:metallophosphoesterase family protein n=1 Tax=Aquisalimonas lutea TaxID=1327750 RepID=UPI0025B35F43|nr:metallophosphoesterase [Aquisalimonas lutea]MDN3518717.1 metallophosphoesterase [Aquisalimonas lutea]
MTGPGRICPLDYRTSPAALNRPADVVADTLYVIGGLYGNTAALAAVQALAAGEVAAGLPAPRLVFNGDFNWFNADSASFRAINTEVLRHTALQGNVEAELADPGTGTGCGCAYPEWVDGATVARSNAIMERLQATGREHPDIVDGLGRLPRQLTAAVTGTRIAVIHGDPESLAGWGLAAENMPPPGHTPAQMQAWFREAGVDVFACTHTCLPYAQTFHVDGAPRLVVNNGATGMPNFRDDIRGVLTRISRRPAPAGALYGTRVGEAYCQAVAIECVPPNWRSWFREVWPAGSAAELSYGARLDAGPAYHLDDARRLGPARDEAGEPRR